MGINDFREKSDSKKEVMDKKLSSLKLENAGKYSQFMVFCSCKAKNHYG
ncbi:hypothetical protein LQZ18_03265 [Lachnospiraceae bacterium ZAX-1]